MADLKITELPALTTVLGEDLLAIVDDPTGTASTKKIRTDDFQSTWHVGARVYNSAALAIGNASETVLTFDSERYDTDTIHATGTNTERLTCKTAGKYIAIGNIDWEYATAGRRFFRIYMNATIIASVENSPDEGYLGQLIVAEYVLAVNDYLSLKVYQNSGGSLNINVGGNYSPIFSMRRIG